MSERDRHADEISHQDVLDYLEEHGPASTEQVAKDLYNDRWTCDDCGRQTEAAGELYSAVKNILLKLSDQNRVLANADWEYEVINRD